MTGMITSCQNCVVKAPHTTWIVLISYLLLTGDVVLADEDLLKSAAMMQFILPHKEKLAFRLATRGGSTDSC